MNKAKLPTKTKIAVWWLIAFGGILTILAILYIFELFLQTLWSSSADYGFLYIVLFLGGIFTFISGIFLLKKSKRAWIVAVTVLVIATTCSIGGYLQLAIDSANYSKIPIALLVGLLIYLTPLILVILDRKNYFEMIRQRELSKKENG
jgi:cation transport ATPase